MSNWKPYNGVNKLPDYFLLRMKGIHPGRGVPYTPVVAQLINGDLYTLDNELEALSWGCHDTEGHLYEERNPFKANLEWCAIPE